MQLTASSATWIDICVPRRGLANNQVGVRVAQEKRRLEKYEARRPDIRPSSKPRKDLLGHDRLNQKQQERADEDGDGVEGHGTGSVWPRAAERRRRLKLEACILPEASATEPSCPRCHEPRFDTSHPMTVAPSPLYPPSLNTSASGENNPYGRSSGP